MAKFTLPSFNAKLFGFIIFALLVLVGLPVTLYEVQQQQNIYQHASWTPIQPQYYYCTSAMGVWLSNGQENPDCPSGSSNVASFQSSVLIKAADNTYGAYAIHYLWAQFWCPTAHAGPCILNGSGTVRTIGIEGSHGTQTAVTIPSDVKAPTPNFSGQKCGTYQFDFAFYLTDNTNQSVALCTRFNASNLNVNFVGGTNNMASWCTTTNDCVAATPTPTNSPTPTHSPTPTFTPTPSVPPTFTPTPSLTPSLTPSDTPTPSLTNVPTETPTETPTDTPTDTPTATPTATMTLTPTITPTPPPGSTNTPTPTLTNTPTPGPSSTPTNTPPPGSTATPTTPPGVPTHTPTPTVIVRVPTPTIPPSGPENLVASIGVLGLVATIIGGALLVLF